MPLFGRLIKGEAKERAEERAAKRKLELKLGRKVADHELYSLGAHMEAAEEQDTRAAAPPVSSTPQSAPKRRSKATKLLLLTGIVGVVLLVAGVFFVFNMSEHDFNRLNPFSPRPPAGAYQAQIGKYERSVEPSHVKAINIGEGQYFYAYYSPPAGPGVKYALWNFPSATDAQRGFIAEKKRVEGYASDGTKIVQQDESRYATVWLKDGQASVYWLDGARVIKISGSTQEAVYEFEGLLRSKPPVAVVEVQLGAGKEAGPAVAPAVTVVDLLNEYQKDSTAADKKYKGKTIIVAGEVAVVDKDKRGNPIVGFMKPGATSPTAGMVGCTFHKSHEAAVSTIKKGQVVQLKGRVFGMLVASVVLEECSKL